MTGFHNLNAPLVSVVTSVRNGMPYLPATVQSIQRQSFRDWEHVIVDDGSTDGTSQWLGCAMAADSRIRVVQEQGRGLAIALNRSVHEARGVFLARLDGDDLASPDRLEQHIAFFNANPDHVAVGSSLRHVDVDGDPITISYFPQENEDIQEALLRSAVSISHGACMFRKSAIVSCGGYRLDFPIAEDYDLFLRLAEIGRLANLPNPLTEIRRHPQSVTSQRQLEQKRWVLKALTDALQRRGLENTAIHSNTTNRQSQRTFSARIACQAARSGNHRTAIKHLRIQVGNDPFSFLTLRCIAEAAARSVISSMSRVRRRAA